MTEKKEWKVVSNFRQINFIKINLFNYYPNKFNGFQVKANFLYY